MNVLVLCAHPDDLEFSVPGLLLTLAGPRRAETGVAEHGSPAVRRAIETGRRVFLGARPGEAVRVHVASFTRGEMSSFTDRTGSTTRAATIRTAELRASQRILTGTTPDFLGTFDQEVRVTPAAVARLATYIRRQAPTHVVAPEPVFTWYNHPDHLNAGRLAYLALLSLSRARGDASDPRGTNDTNGPGRTGDGEGTSDSSEDDGNPGTGHADPQPRLYYFQSIWNDWYLPRFPAFKSLVEAALAAHASQRGLLTAARVPGFVEQFIHGLKVRGHLRAEGLRYQPIPAREGATPGGTPRKQFACLSFRKRLIYYFTKSLAGREKQRAIYAARRARAHDGTLPASVSL